MGEGVVRVLTIDDHPAFLRVAHELVEATPGFEPVGEASSAAEGLRAIDELHPDLVLADINMPGMTGIELTRRIGPATVTVLVSSSDPSEIPLDALTCGAVAVLRKEELSPARLLELWAAHGNA